MRATSPVPSSEAPALGGARAGARRRQGGRALAAAALACLALCAALTGAPAAPGLVSVYCNEGYLLASAVVEAVSGKSHAQFTRDEIFAPLGMTCTFCPVNEDVFAGGDGARCHLDGSDGEQAKPHEICNPMGSGGVYSTPTDLGKLGTMLMDWGRHGGRTFLSRSAHGPATAAWQERAGHSWPLVNGLPTFTSLSIARGTLLQVGEIPGAPGYLAVTTRPLTDVPWSAESTHESSSFRHPPDSPIASAFGGETSGPRPREEETLSEESAEWFIAEMRSDPALAAQFDAASSPEERLASARAVGRDVTTEELEAALKETVSDDELEPMAGSGCVPRGHSTAMPRAGIRSSVATCEGRKNGEPKSLRPSQDRAT